MQNLQIDSLVAKVVFCFIIALIQHFITCAFFALLIQVQLFWL